MRGKIIGFLILVALAPALLLAVSQDESTASITKVTYSLRIAIVGDTRPLNEWNPPPSTPDLPTAGFYNVMSNIRNFASYNYDYAIGLGDFVNVDRNGETQSTIDSKYSNFLNGDASHTAQGLLSATLNDGADAVFFVPGNHEQMHDTYTINHNTYHAKLGTGNPALLTGLIAPDRGQLNPPSDPRFAQDDYYTSVTDPTTQVTINFLFLDSAIVRYAGYIPEDQYEYSRLRDRLIAITNSNPNAWIVACLHNPIWDERGGQAWSPEYPGYPVGLHNQERVDLSALFDQYGVDLVLQAHNHFYRRHMQPAHGNYKIPYITQGQGGATSHPYNHQCPIDANDLVYWGNEQAAYGYSELLVATDGTLRFKTYAGGATGVFGQGDYFILTQVPKQ